MAIPRVVYRSFDGFTDFEQGSTSFDSNMRHCALWKNDDELHVFWSRVGNAPERIYVSRIALKGNWMDRTATEPLELMRPEKSWVGAAASLVPSQRSFSKGGG